MSVMEKDQLVEADLQAKVVPTRVSSENVDKPSFLDVWPQVFASLVSLSSAIQAGINLAFSGVLIPQLSADTNLKDNFTKVEASWIASLVVISQPIGSFVAGPLMDIFGRKTICIFQNVPIIIAWIIMFFTRESLWPIYLSRLLAGFGAGLTLVGLVYTAEIAHVSYRAMLLSTNSVNVAFGILVTTVVGVYIDWHYCSLVFGLLSIASLLLSFLIPESPYWMASFTDTRQEDTRLVVRKLNLNNDAYSAEWQRIQEAVRKRRTQMEAGEGSKGWCSKFRDTCYNFKERGSYLPFIILLVLFLLQQTSGTYVVIFYTVNIFQSIGGNFGFGFNEYTATIAVGILRFILSLVAAGISRVMGRRPIMILSAAGMALSAGASAGFLFANDINTLNFSTSNSTGNSTLPSPSSGVISDWWIMLSILLYVAAGSIGIMVIPWTLVSELLPIKVRAFGSGLMISYGAVLLFIIIKTFPFLVDLITLPAVFIIYAVMSAVCTIFIYFFLPETLGKSFSEIEKYFEKKTDSNIS